MAAGPLDVLRAVHIAAGALSLLVFTVPMVTRKGGVVHRRVGGVFVGAMSVAAVTAAAMTLTVLADPTSPPGRCAPPTRCPADDTPSSRSFAAAPCERLPPWLHTVTTVASTHEGGSPRLAAIGRVPSRSGPARDERS